MTRGRSGLFSQLNAGKRSIALDLAAACDVAVENFRPGILDRFGAGWPALSAVNPRLVMLSVSGFGQDGDESERPAYAPVIHAEAGLIGCQADISLLEAMLATDDYTHYSIDEHPVWPARGEAWPAPG